MLAPFKDFKVVKFIIEFVFIFTSHLAEGAKAYIRQQTAARAPTLINPSAVPMGAAFQVFGGGTDDDVRYVEQLIRFSRVWEPSPEHPMDYEAEDGLMATIREICTHYNVVCVVYDPYQMHQTMTNFAKEGLVWCKPFSQGADRMEGDSALLSMIQERRIWHTGQPELRDHLTQAGAKHATDNDTKLRLVKKEAKSHIDLVVALSMATYQCDELALD